MSFNTLFNELFISLPDEIKKMILHKLPIEYYLEKDEITTTSIINEYITEYIEGNLLSDMSKSGYLNNTILYKKIVRDNVNKLALYYATKFIYYANTHSGGVVHLNKYIDKEVNVISLNIIFKFTKVGNYYSGSTDESNFIISNDGWNYINKCSKIYYNTTIFIDYTEDSIKAAIYNVLIRQMDYSDTTEDIKSMKIIKTTYPKGINNYKIFTEQVLYTII
jgi:hypothetical protein